QLQDPLSRVVHGPQPLTERAADHGRSRRPSAERLLEPRLDGTEEGTHQPAGALLDAATAPPPVRPVHDEGGPRVYRNAQRRQHDGRPGIEGVNYVERVRAQSPDTTERVVWVPSSPGRTPPQVGHLDDTHAGRLLLPHL